MGIPTIELVYAPATEVVRQDPHNKDAVAASISILKAQEGLIKYVPQEWHSSPHDPEEFFICLLAIGYTTDFSTRIRRRRTLLLVGSSAVLHVQTG